MADGLVFALTPNAEAWVAIDRIVAVVPYLDTGPRGHCAMVVLDGDDERGVDLGSWETREEANAGIERWLTDIGMASTFRFGEEPGAVMPGGTKIAG